MWDGHSENFMVPHATSKGAEASLPSGSYTSAPRPLFGIRDGLSWRAGSDFC